jgi:hypothetical protein
MADMPIALTSHVVSSQEYNFAQFNAYLYGSSPSCKKQLFFKTLTSAAASSCKNSPSKISVNRNLNYFLFCFIDAASINYAKMKEAIQMTLMSLQPNHVLAS